MTIEDSMKRIRQPAAGHDQFAISSPGFSSMILHSDFRPEAIDNDDFFFLEKKPKLMLSGLNDDPIIGSEQHYDTIGGSFFSNQLDFHCSTSGDDNQFLFCDVTHPRHKCMMFPFISPPCLSNNSYCSKCWCFFCQAAAPCSKWGTGANVMDHCNASASNWYCLQQKQDHVREASEQGLMTISARPSSMSGLSHGLYGPSCCPLPLSSAQPIEQRMLHEEPAETDCFSPCASALVTSRARGDPSMDPVWFEFGTVHVPIEVQQPETFLNWPLSSFDKFSLDVFFQKLGEGKDFRLQCEDFVEDSSLVFEFRTLNYRGLLDELALNEAQGQLQVDIILTPDVDANKLGTADIKVFLKKERGDELLVLNELLKELFPEEINLQQNLTEVEEMRQWAESNTEWMSFSGLLKDLESNGYSEASQPSGLTVPLRAYQLQSLQLMLDAEHREGGLLSVNYQQLPCQPAGNQLLYSSSLLHLMDFKEGDVRGGFLCEEMGLGKTIEILALILANPCPAEYCDKPLSSRGTLVVCPVSIVGQWANEVKNKLDSATCNLSTYMYHGSKRIRDPKKLAKFDIVITTYATLGSDFSKATQATRHGSDFAEQFCPLLSVSWWRVVLDESHTVKDPAPLHSRACARLKANRRWCCTGTPINTSIYDLYGQFLFLKLEPLDNKSIFRRRIGRPYERHCKNDDQTALLWTLNKIMIRHTKLQKFNGRELLRLPPKTEQDIPVSFTLEERAVYEAVYQKVIAKFEQFRCWGPTVVSKNILQIMSLLLPLRRLCSGGFVSSEELTPIEKKESSGICADPVTDCTSLPEVEDIVECGICFDLMESPTKTPCGHWFCSECVISALGVGVPACPTCSTPVSASSLVTRTKKATPLLDLPTTSLVSVDSTEDEIQMKGVRIESKLRTLLADLAAIRAENDGAKVLIFSQFMQTIAWLKSEFKKQGINYRFISGDMPMKKRAQAIETFQKESPTTVFLLSIRTGAVGITLTAASHVYMLEPCLNPALEEQAVGRCWRMGQERPVVIKRLYVENSVEANILKLFRSRNLTSSGLTGPQDADNSFRSKTGKAGALDVAGCIRTDKQNLRLNEFEILFS